MVRHRKKVDATPGSVDALQHANGAVLVPTTTPPTWLGKYFYVVNHVEELCEPYEPLRCLRLAEWDVRRSARKVTLQGVPVFSVLVAVLPALDTPSGYVTPWEILVGGKTFASLRPPAWVVFATGTGEGSAACALERVTTGALRRERELRLSQVERAIRSAKLLEDVRQSQRRMVVQWFDDRGRVCGESSFASGHELFDALIDPETRNRPHLIGFPDGWYVNGVNWLT